LLGKSNLRMCVLHNLFEVHMYLNEYNKLKSGTVTTGMINQWDLSMQFKYVYILQTCDSSYLC